MSLLKTKGVAFNLDDPDQNELYEWAMSRTNFSAYVKRLIQSDFEKKRWTTGAEKPSEPIRSEPPAIQREPEPIQSNPEVIINGQKKSNGPIKWNIPN